MVDTFLSTFVRELEAQVSEASEAHNLNRVGEKSGPIVHLFPPPPRPRVHFPPVGRVRLTSESSHAVSSCR